jgi:hypothetical protein
MKPHKHAEVIKAWADGAEIECRRNKHLAWVSAPSHPAWLLDVEYRVKPLREFPKTSLSEEDFKRLLNINRGIMSPAMEKIIADEAIKQYILDQEAVEAGK